MKPQTIKNILGDFFKFLTQKNNLFLFTALFYALWIIQSLVASEKFELHSLNGRMLGIATLQGYDVGARVTLFYKCALLLPLFFVLFNFLGFLLVKRNSGLLFSPELPLLNCASLAGIFLFAFQVFEIRVFETLEFVYFIHKFVIAAILLRLLLFKKNTISVFHYVLILSIAVSLYFFVADVVNFLGYDYNPDFYIVTFILCFLLLLGLHFYLRKHQTSFLPNDLRNIFRALSPMMFFPLVSVFKDEIFLILKANDILLSSPFLIWSALVVVLLSIVFIRIKTQTNKLPDVERKQLAQSYFPRLLFSIITYTFYNSAYEFYDELFELGNKYLPIMEYKLFGVIPTLEKFNSHLLSDYFFSIFYSAFNGTNIVELEFYDFFFVPISFLLYYYLMLFITRNTFVALFSVLFFPFAATLFPGGFCLGILALMVLYRIINTKPSLKNYLLLFISITFFIYWRSDLGYSCVLVMPLILLFYHVADTKFKINWKYLAQAFLIVIGSIIVVFSALSLYRGVNIFYKLLYALHYLASAQTYGYNIVHVGQILEYKMHYFVFPVLICMILFALLFRFKSLNSTSAQRFSYLSLLFLCAYYFANFNRGLVRHSLVEGVDNFTSSYLYIILPSALFVFFKDKLRQANFIVFFALAFFMILLYTLPHNNEHISLFEKTVEKVKTSKNINLAKLESRVINLPKENANQAFIDFAQKNIHGNETFIDFVNRPMLYFYTQKITPSYFYQNPLCSHDDFLQNRFVADLAEYNAPYLIYSTLSGDGFVVDGIPNSVRHYRMAEYFYQNYSPYVIIDDYCLWRRNDVPDRNKKDTLFTYTKTENENSDIIHKQISFQADKNYLVKTVYLGKTGIDTVKADAGRLKNYLVADTIVYSVLQGTEQSEYHLTWNTKNIHEILVLECDYIPDFYTENYFNYGLQKLPRIFGTYDKLLSKETILFDAKEQITNSAASSFTISENLDKTSGNTILVTFKNKTKELQTVYMYVGKGNPNFSTVVSFDVVPADKEETYAVRISSDYKWYSQNPSKISFWWAWGSNVLEITDFKITKGN